LKDETSPKDIPERKIVSLLAGITRHRAPPNNSTFGPYRIAHQLANVQG
jgi:hypothetical protein